MNISQEDQNRFENYIMADPNSGCWLWTASLKPNGYGRFKFAKTMWLTHRFSYELYVGPIPDGLHVLHKCDVRSCVRPDHLFLGTNADNVADKCSKGRLPRGEDAGQAKLTKAQVIEILRTPGTNDAVAARFGVSKSQVSAIRNGKKWAHIFKEFHELAN